MLAPILKMLRAATSPVTFSKEAYNYLWDLLETHNKAIRSQELVVQPPLYLTNDGVSGQILRVSIPPGGGDLPTGQYPDMMYGVVTIGQQGFLFNRAHSMT